MTDPMTAVLLAAGAYFLLRPSRGGGLSDLGAVDKYGRVDRLRSDTDLLTGRQYGNWLVGKIVGRRFHGKIRQHLYEVKCLNCGNEFEASRTAITRAPRFCKQCVRTGTAEMQATRLPSGKSIYDIARAAGLPVNTVWKRWKRGWPEKDLGLPRVAPFTKRGLAGFGADAEEEDANRKFLAKLVKTQRRGARKTLERLQRLMSEENYQAVIWEGNAALELYREYEHPDRFPEAARDPEFRDLVRATREIVREAKRGGRGW